MFFLLPGVSESVLVAKRLGAWMVLQSVIFTGIYGYAIAAAWVLLGLLLSLLVCFKSLLRWRRRRARRSSSSRSKTLPRAPASYSISRLVVVLLSTAAMYASLSLFHFSVLLAGLVFFFFIFFFAAAHTCSSKHNKPTTALLACLLAERQSIGWLFLLLHEDRLFCVVVFCVAEDALWLCM